MKNIVLNLYRIVFARPLFRKINFFIFQLSLRGLGVLNCENNKVSGELYLVTKILPVVVNSGIPVFFDVGANAGNYSISLLEQFPSAVVHAFEPHPGNYLRLKEKMLPSNVNIYNVALGEMNQRLTLYDRADQDGSVHASLHEDVISEIHKQEVITFEVEVESLDEFSNREGIDYIDFLKIDTEGNELAILQGASRLLESGNIGCIHFEFNEMNIVTRVFFRDFRKLLCNYELFRLLPNGLLRLGDSPLETELFAYQNILALPRLHLGAYSF